MIQSYVTKKIDKESKFKGFKMNDYDNVELLLDLITWKLSLLYLMLNRNVINWVIVEYNVVRFVERKLNHF